MRARLAGLIAAVVVTLLFGPLHLATADGGPVCPNGTNWDNSIHACR